MLETYSHDPSNILVRTREDSDNPLFVIIPLGTQSLNEIQLEFPFTLLGVQMEVPPSLLKYAH